MNDVNSGLTFNLFESAPVTGEKISYLIINSPVTANELMSLHVNKLWDKGNMGSEDMYKQLTITMHLLADGQETGQSVTLNFQNGWTNTFTNLPKTDSSGKTIVYSVRESGQPDGWAAQYGAMTEVPGEQNSYSITVTNTYQQVYNLPKTGGTGLYGVYILGSILTVSALILLCEQRRRKKSQ